MRHFDVLPDFSLTTSEIMGDCYLLTWYVQVTSPVAERLKTQALFKFGNVRKVSKLRRMITYRTLPLPK